MSEAPLPERVKLALRRAWDRLEPWAEKQWIGITLAALAITLVAGALIFVRNMGGDDEAKEDDATAAAPTEAPPAPAPGAAPSPGAVPAATSPAITEPSPPASALVGDAGKPLSPNVKVTFRTYPQRRASVMWGGKRLGFIDRGKPLVVERPRDSGPLDVVIRSPGFVPVHVRAYTFDDNTVDVKITPNDKKDTIFGYKQPLPPEDAGAPPPL